MKPPINNNLPITSGQWRGRKLQTPGGMATRPTLSRVRQAIFNKLRTMLGHDWGGFNVLDICAGSGALAFESLSNGAGRAICIDNLADAHKIMVQNAKILQCENRVDIWQKPIERVNFTQQFDIIFADPPFDDGALLAKLSFIAQPILKNNGVFVFQTPAEFPLPPLPVWQYCDAKKYGISQIYFLKKSSIAVG